MPMAPPAIHLESICQDNDLIEQRAEVMAANEKLQIRLNPEQRERLRQIAEARGVTASDVLKDAIAEQWFKLRDREQLGNGGKGI